MLQKEIKRHSGTSLQDMPMTTSDVSARQSAVAALNVECEGNSSKRSATLRRREDKGAVVGMLNLSDRGGGNAEEINCSTACVLVGTEMGARAALSDDHAQDLARSISSE